MRIVIISDTHNNDIFNELPDGDMLIHCGDSTQYGEKHEFEKFIFPFMSCTKFDTKVFIAGNHDSIYQYKERYIGKKSEWIKNVLSEENLSQSDLIYLEDTSFIFTSSEFSRPIKIYGSPYVPRYGLWSYMIDRNSYELLKKWEEIPNDTDILITHGPPHSILDEVERMGYTKNTGCELLYTRVFEINPILHCFGHIHDQHGYEKVKETTFINASICDGENNNIYHPIVIDLKEINGKFEVFPVKI